MDKKVTFVRIWQEMDIEEVKKQIILIDDLYGTCGNCRKLGLNYLKDKKCPDCGAIFKYIATSLKNSSDQTKIMNRLKQENLQLIMIDKDDYNKANAQNAVKDLFK